MSERECFVLKAGDTLWRGPLDDSEHLTLKEDYLVCVIGVDYHNECLILEIDFSGKDKPERFYLPLPANHEKFINTPSS